MAVKGNQIGSVYIKVRPDASDFRKDTQRQVDKETAGQPIKVKFELDLEEGTREKLRREVQKAARDAELDSGNVTLEAGLDTEGLDETLREVADRKVALDVEVDKDSLRDFDAFLDRFRQEQGEDAINISADLDDASVRRVQDSLAGITGRQIVDLEFTEDTHSFDAVRRRLAEFLDEPAEKKVEATFDFSTWSKVEKEIGEEPISKEIIFRYTEDLEGYESLLARIEKIRRERASIEVDLELDDSALDQLEAHARGRVAELNARVSPASVVATESTMSVLARDRFVDIKARVNARALATASGAFMSLAGLNTVGDFVRMLENVAMNFDTVMMQVGLVSGAIGTMASVGTVAIGGLLTTVRDMAGAFELLAFAPTALLSAFTGLQAWSSIWGGFEAALMKIPGALEALPPAAQQGVKAIEDLQDATKAVVQNNFWAQMSDELYRFAENIGPTVVEAMGNVASEMGRAVSSMLDHTEKLTESGQLQEFADNNTRLYKDLADAVVPTFEALMTLGIRGSKYLPTIGRALEDAALNFRDFIDHADDTGKIDQWIRTGAEAFRDMGTSAIDTFKILGNFADIFERLNIGGLEEMARGLERIEAFTASSGFQRKMENIFEGAKDGAAAAAAGFGDLVEEMYRSDQLVSDLLRKSGQLAGTFMTALADAGSSQVFQQGLLDALDGVQDFINYARPAFEDIADIFGRLGTIGAEVAREIAPGLNITMGVIDEFLERIGPSLANAVEPLTRIFEDLATMGHGPLMVMAEVAGAALDVFGQFPPVLQNIVLLLAAVGRTGAGAALAAGLGNASTQFVALERSAAAASTGVSRHMATMRANVATTTAGIKGTFVGMWAAMQAGAAGAAGRFAATMSTMRSAAVAATGVITGAFRTMWAAVGGWAGVAIAGIIGIWSSITGANQEAAREVEALTRALREQSEEALRLEIFEQMKEDLQAFADAGGDVGRVMDMLEGGDVSKLKDDLREIANTAQILAAGEGFAGDNLMQNLGFDEARLESGIKLMGEYGLSQEDAALNAQNLGYAADQMGGRLGEAEAEAALLEAALGETGAEMERMAEASPRFQAIADAIARVRDEAASTEDRVRALRDAMELLGEGPASADEYEKEAYRTMDRVIETLEAAYAENEGRFKLSQLFDEDGTTNLSTEIGRTIDDMFRDAVVSADNGMMALRERYENGDIGLEEFNAGIAAEYDKLVAQGEAMGRALGYTGDELEAFKERWIQFLEGSGTTEANYRISLDGAVEVEDELARLTALGQEFSQAEYEAIFDADNDGVVTKVEQAERLAAMFTAQRWEANLTGNDEEIRAKLIEAAEAGAMFDGMEWIATLNSDGTLNQEAVDAALQYGLMFDGKEWTALLDADGGPSAAAIETARQAGAEWDGSTWVSTIDADKGPTDAQIAAARRLGLEWDGSEWVSTLDADEEQAVDGARRAKDAVDSVPESKTSRINAQVSGLADLAELRRRIEAIKSKNVTVNTHLSTSGAAAGRSYVQADGGFMGTGTVWDRFKDGGFKLSPKPNVAHIASAGSYVTYAESETGGEAFIPLHPSKRERSVAIWQETGRRLGMADGGVVNAPAVASGNTYMISVPRPGANGDDIAQALGFYDRKSRRL